MRLPSLTLTQGLWEPAYRLSARPQRPWVAEAGALYPLTRDQVEELEGGVLVAKASRGKFQKEGVIGLDLQDT